MEMEAKRSRSETVGATRLASKAKTAACVAGIVRELSQGRGKYAMTSASAHAMSQARTGDPGALSFLYARYADDVYGRARMIVDDHDAALDITRRVFAKLKRLPERSEGRYDEQPEDFQRALGTIDD
jgi:hypothetical protein